MTFEELKNKMHEITGLLFTHPDKNFYRATEVWIKFKNSGKYVFIDFEQPFPELIELQNLVGAGNALNCSDYKKDNELIQYKEVEKIKKILSESIRFKSNLEKTVSKTKELFEDFSGPLIHY